MEKGGKGSVCVCAYLFIFFWGGGEGGVISQNHAIALGLLVSHYV